MNKGERTGEGPYIHLAFRFHINFYHSYRGDTPDELGFGKDIRIIRSILDDLDALNREGIRIRGTWDVENYYSLQKIMPEHCPDIISRIQERVNGGLDEIEMMSWNNGIVSACNEEELQLVIARTISNTEGSGLADLFSRWTPVLRPQECMYTPSFLRYYPEAGVTGISTYYSSHPFNGFSNFIPPLTTVQRHNPLTLRAEGQEGSMTMIPCYNNGDVADHLLSLRHWVRHLRRRQKRKDVSRDLLLLIDMDADDEFWSGIDIPIVSGLLTSLGGLKRMVRSIAEFSYVRFTTAGEYLKDHGPAGTITVNQDTADGSFDGLSSWAEKWDNTALWSVIQDSRRTAEAASFLADLKDRRDDPFLTSLLLRSLETRVLTQSTTHFGMASPVMNSDRLQQGMSMAQGSLDSAREALHTILKENDELTGSHLAGPSVTEEGRGTLCYLSTECGDTQPALIRLSRTAMPSRLVPGAELERVITGSQEKDMVTGEAVACGEVSLTLLQGGDIEMRIAGRVINAPGFPRTAVTYGKKTFSHHDGLIDTAKVLQHTHREGGYTLTLSGRFSIDRGKEVQWRHRYHIAPDLPYIYVDVEVTYPDTEHRGYDKAKAQRLNASWDARWKEVMPWQFSPAGEADADHPWSIWKHNFLGDVSHYDLNYGTFSKNRNLDSFNNQITNAWVGASCSEGGWLIAQSSARGNNFAFCPMRLRDDRLLMNPFGSYYGRQWKYGVRETGLGRLFSLGMADHLDPYAPSYNGRTSSFSLMIASVSHEPDPLVQRDAQVFCDGILSLERTSVIHEGTD